MPFEKFDRSRLSLLPLSQRVHDVHKDIVMDIDGPIPEFDNPKLDLICDDILRAREKGAPVIVMYGAHVIRSGCARFMIRLMELGLVTHFATNGAGSIHDFEMSLTGATCESVARYISEGQFGLWKETGLINDAVKAGADDDLGAGEAIGRYIENNNFPYRDLSVLAAGYRLQVPVTVHIGIGNDIIHEHPNCSGQDLGKTSYNDFLIYAGTISHLEGGVFLNFGSAVTGPEVYLKCLAMARNVAHHEGRKITDFTTAVFDLLPLEGESVREAPEKNDPRYYFRPWKTILARTVADGGRSYYIQGEHRATFSNLAVRLIKRSGGRENGIRKA
jgi:hypothetical protein